MADTNPQHETRDGKAGRSAGWPSRRASSYSHGLSSHGLRVRAFSGIGRDMALRCAGTPPWRCRAPPRTSGMASTVLPGYTQWPESGQLLPPFPGRRCVPRRDSRTWHTAAGARGRLCRSPNPTKRLPIGVSRPTRRCRFPHSPPFHGSAEPTWLSVWMRDGCPAAGARNHLSPPRQ